MSSLSVLSSIIGWLYFISWGVSFYGQIYENWKWKHVKGMSFEFVGLNLTGFLFLSMYSTIGYFDPSQLAGSVEVQDLAFAYNAVIATIVTIAQAFIYPKEKGQTVENWCVFFLIALWGFTISYLFITIVFEWYVPVKELNLFALMGYQKLLISLVKYLPQVYRNYRRQSTQGWSIFNILTDFMGGALSFLQIVINNLDAGKTDIIDGNLNIVKFGLSIISMFFDVIFFVQHYILYTDRDDVNYKNIVSTKQSTMKSLSRSQIIRPSKQIQLSEMKY